MTQRARKAAEAVAPVLKAPPPNVIRAELEDLLFRDLLGPAGGEHEEIADGSVRDRYLVGMLAPRHQQVRPEVLDRLAQGGATSDEDGAADDASPATPTLTQASIGLSFCVDGETTAIKVTARWGRYERVESETLETETGKGKLVWRRVPVEGTLAAIRLVDGDLAQWTVVPEQPEVVVKGVARRHGAEWVVTLFLVNGQTEPKIRRDAAWVFQPELIVEAVDSRPCFCRRLQARDGARIDKVDHAEDRAMAMAYRSQVEFAVGHGVAVHAETSSGDPDRAARVTTRFVPAFEVPRQTPPTAADIPALSGLLLDMKDLAETPDDQFAPRLAALPDAYEAWIARQRARLAGPGEGLADFGDATGPALERCEKALGRIREGLELLGSDPIAAEAFRFANRAMWLQRTQSILAEQRRRGGQPDIAKIDVPDNRRWYPFQLAFLLLNLPGLTRLEHPDRTEESSAVADLLWFPTGGGKTEAYLGLSAYAMGLRRLQGDVAGRPGQYGVAVLMRYTLRLLTLQQFQRAAALVCACEWIRTEAIKRGSAKWGSEPFRIGLWVGQKTTPNWTDEAAEAVKEHHGHWHGGRGGGTPAQLTHCPWCGHEVDPGQHIIVDTRGRRRTHIYCGDKLGNCPFSERHARGEGIPVLVVDEEIYRRLPALLIATVDKFAQMPWNGLVQMIFGRVTGRCARHGFVSPEMDDAPSHQKLNDLPPVKQEDHGPLRPPDLIIQDELHLISGPLGSLVGLYETAVDELCCWDVNGRRVRPKVVASTATIRKAGDQVHALFLRRVEVFPPQGLDAADNFFSLQRTPGEANPGRRYLGVCAPGRRMKATLIRVYTALLAGAQTLFDRYGAAADPWMTLVGYFNSIRELGGMRRLVDDDIRTRLRDMDRRGLAKRRAPIMEELTSRKSATDIPAILDQLEVVFEPAADAGKKRGGAATRGRKVPLDVLLATNMISVGVDVKRLGLMVVGGQPKTTAEYIQATSRIGRTWPGLVVTVFNWARPRDLSHYERFEHYHATFYQHVEALSVTPFALRALDRGIAALLVSLVRLAGAEYNPNASAQELLRDHAFVQRAVDVIARRAALVAGDQAAFDDAKARIERLLDVWLAQVAHLHGGARLGYRDKQDGLTRGLLVDAGTGRWEDFTCLNSLRDVEPNVHLVLDEHGMDDGPGAVGGGAA